MSERFSKSPEQPPFQFKQMEKGQDYIVLANLEPLMTLEKYRETHAINATPLAALKLPALNKQGEELELHLIDFGEFDKDDPSQYPSIFWNTSDNTPLPGMGRANRRFGLNAANFKPSTHMFGIDLLPPSDRVVIGRNDESATNHRLGLAPSSQPAGEPYGTLSREHLIIRVANDESAVAIRDISRNGTQMALLEAEKGESRQNFVRRILGRKALSEY